MKTLILEVEVNYCQRGFSTYDQRVAITESVHLDHDRLANSAERMQGLVTGSLASYFRNLKKLGGSINICIREVDSSTFMTTALHVRHGLYSTDGAVSSAYLKWYGNEQKTVDKYDAEWEGDIRTPESRSLAMTAFYKDNKRAWAMVRDCLDKWLVDNRT